MGSLCQAERQKQYQQKSLFKLSVIDHSFNKTQFYSGISCLNKQAFDVLIIFLNNFQQLSQAKVISQLPQSQLNSLLLYIKSKGIKQQRIIVSDNPISRLNIKKIVIVQLDVWRDKKQNKQSLKSIMKSLSEVLKKIKFKVTGIVELGDELGYPIKVFHQCLIHMLQELSTLNQNLPKKIIYLTDSIQASDQFKNALNNYTMTSGASQSFIKSVSDYY